MRKRLRNCMCCAVVLLLAGCRSLTTQQMDGLDRLADYSIMKLKGDRSDVHGLLHSVPGYVVAKIDRGSLVEGFKANGVLVLQSDAFNRYIIMDQLVFDGAEDVMKFTVVIMLSETDLSQVLNGVLKVKDAAADRRVYFYAREQRCTVYPLQQFRIKVVDAYSSGSDV